MAHHGHVPRPGQLLLASPLLPEPFDRAVIYVIEHDESGALGVVLNTPSTVDVGEIWPLWRPLVTGDPVVHSGGPVALDTALGLGVLATQVRTDEAGDVPGFRQVQGRYGLVDLDASAEELGAQLMGLRIFAGYAGWSPGQLDAELAEGSWAVVDIADPVGEVFAGDGEDQWVRILRRQPSTLAWWVLCPRDPSWN
jgi:putative transcriptional regulator